jgi:hypothetical protein
MSKTMISFSAKVRIGDERIPLVSEIVFGVQDAQQGVENGFLFKLDRRPQDPPVTVYLGEIIRFIEESLGAGTGSLAANPGMVTLSTLFQQPTATINASDFNSTNNLLINVYEFTINSTTSGSLFAINIDVEGADPTVGMIALPDELNSWVKINSLGISFSTQTTQQK